MTLSVWLAKRFTGDTVAAVRAGGQVPETTQIWHRDTIRLAETKLACTDDADELDDLLPPMASISCSISKATSVALLPTDKLAQVDLDCHANVASATL